MRSSSRFTIILFAALLFVLPVSLRGQDLSERIEHAQLRRAQIQQNRLRSETQYEAPQFSIRQRLMMVLENVDMTDMRLRDAFEWWALRTDVPLTINWEAMLMDGIDPDSPVTVRLRRVTSGQLLGVLMRQASGGSGVRIMFEASPWDIEIMTKAQADQRPVLRIYDIRDLLHVIPSFTNAPEFDLDSALQQNQGGGGGGGGGGGQTSIFMEDESNEGEATLSKQERGEQLAQLIRDTVEPDTWQFYGGQYSSIRYFNNRLVVRAPLYVHRQIGLEHAVTMKQRGVITAGSPARGAAQPQRFAPGSSVPSSSRQRTNNAIERRINN